MKFSYSLKGIERTTFSDWKRMRRYFARRAYDRIEAGGGKAIVLRDETEIVGIACVDWNYIKGYLFVDLFATKRRGYGTLMMKQMRKMAQRRKCSLTLIADHGALGFYRQLKMDERHLFTWITK